MKYGEIVPLSEIEHLLDEDRERDEKLADMKADISKLQVGQVIKFTAAKNIGTGMPAGLLLLLTTDLRGKFNTYQDGLFSYVHRVK